MDNTREKLIELLRNGILAAMDDEDRYNYSDVVEYMMHHGVTLQEHDCFWATEQAYKNGYEAGKKDAVAHGRWVLAKPRVKGRNATYRCTACGKLRSSYYNDVFQWEYCPCGAKMDGDWNG